VAAFFSDREALLLSEYPLVGQIPVGKPSGHGAGWVVKAGVRLLCRGGLGPVADESRRRIENERRERRKRSEGIDASLRGPNGGACARGGGPHEDRFLALKALKNAAASSLDDAVKG
jgi:hypothetical protein